MASEQGIVDSHCHLWRMEVAGQTWLTSDFGVLHRSFQPDDLAEAARSVGIASAVVIEAGSTAEDNADLGRAAESDLIGAVIAHADLRSEELDSELDAWQAHPKFRGIRMRFEGEDDPELALSPGVLDGLEALARRGLIFDFGIRAEHLSAVARSCERLPDLEGVIEHMAKPDLWGDSDHEVWYRGMRVLARNTRLTCKLSLSPHGEQVAGLLAEARRGWSVERVRPLVQFLLAEFGPKRLMWGSDWPISLLCAQYSETYEAMREAIGPLGSDDENRIMRTTAERLYGLEL